MSSAYAILLRPPRDGEDDGGLLAREVHAHIEKRKDP
jgi:hypothetical protein